MHINSKVMYYTSCMTHQKHVPSSGSLYVLTNSQTSYVNGPSILSKSCVPIATRVLRLKHVRMKHENRTGKMILATCIRNCNIQINNTEIGNISRIHILPAYILMKLILEVNKAIISSFIKSYAPQYSTNNKWTYR